MNKTHHHAGAIDLNRLLISGTLGFLLCLASSLSAADTKISAMPSATSVTGADYLPIIQSGANKTATFTVQKNLWDSYYQPLDGDLTAIAALTGTNTIYYRSATNTWTAVTIGSGLDFTSGTLSATGGGGGGSVDDTPFASSWNGVTGTAPSKNAVYDELHLIDTDDNGKVNVLDMGAGIANTNSSGVLQAAITNNSSNWNTAFTDRLKWDGGATGLTASTGRTSLGATTVGSNIFTLANPSSITFLRMNADNTVDARSAFNFRSDIGLAIGTDVQAWDADLDALAALTGTNTIYYRSASNTWSAVTIGSGLDFTGATLSATGGSAVWGAITGTLSDQTDLQSALDAKQPLDGDLTALAAVTGTNTIYYRSASNTWTAVTMGGNMTFSGGTLDTTAGSAGVSDTAFASSWNGVTGTAPSKNAVYDEIHLFDTADDGSIINAGTGFRIGGAASSGKILVGNGTNYVASTPTFPNASATSGKVIKSDGTNWVASTETYAAPGTSGNVLTSDGTNWTSAAPSGVGGGTTVKVSGSDFATSSTSLVDITGLSFSASTSTVYEVDVLLKCQSSDTSGLRFALAYSAAGATGTYTIIAPQGAGSTSQTFESQSLGTSNGINKVTTANTDETVWVKAVVTIGANSGNITMKVNKQTSGTATIYIGSRMTVTQL